jgi:hypothetical protein
MTDVIDFPTESVRNKALIEKTIKKLLDETSLDEEAKDELKERLLRISDYYELEYSVNFPIELPPGVGKRRAEEIGATIREGFEKFEETIHNHLDKILTERLQTEIKLYFLENSDYPAS